MANERVTEDIVDAKLRQLGYFDDDSTAAIEKQQSAIAAIRTALAKAGKAGKGGAGKPEFIITAVDTPDVVIVIECKASVTHHESNNRDRPAEYAVDGALHYARALSQSYTVIAVAVSGDEKHLKLDNFLLAKGATEEKPLFAPTGAQINDLVPLTDYIRAASFDPAVQAKRTHDLIGFSQDLHVFMRDEAELEEKESRLWLPEH